jgi:hypothetical protein
MPFAFFRGRFGGSKEGAKLSDEVRYGQGKCESTGRKGGDFPYKKMVIPFYYFYIFRLGRYRMCNPAGVD